MLSEEKILFDGDTEFGHYQVVDMVYMGRKARVLFSGRQQAAQSGIAHDDDHDLLFDYNQRFLELASTLRPRRLLLIGGGAYTLPMALINSLPDIHVDVVERDPKLLDIAESYFGLKPNKRLQIFHYDGLAYLKDTEKAYEMILIDAFEHNKIPKELANKKFINLVYEKLKANGVSAMNIISSFRGPNAEAIRIYNDAYMARFNNVQIYPADKLSSEWISQNFLVIAQKGRKHTNYGLRFPAMQTL